ncbi:MAG: HdeD family acid-resistance protein [Ilumatobacteraceae bacterium]
MSDTMESDPGTKGLQMAREWPAVMMVGLVTLVLGIVIISWPQETLVVISVLLGIQLLIFGVYRLINAFAHDVEHRGFLAIVGIVGIIAGVIVLRHPFETVVVLAVVLGIVWIITGVIDIIGALGDSGGRDRGARALFGVVSLIAGIVVVSWPEPTVTVVAWISGLYLIIFGLFICFESFQLRRLTK